MNEKPTLEIIAPTVEEALTQGLAQLGLPAEAVSLEVLDAGTKGLFGLGGRQVRVRLTIKSDDDDEIAAPASAPYSKAATEKSSKIQKKKKSKQKAKGSATKEKGTPAGILNLVEETVSKLLFHMNMQAQISAEYAESDREGRKTIHVDIRGEDLSGLIGRRSETLNAFQYIASLMVGKEVEQWVHLVVDVEGHRSRREDQLRRMANRLSEQVIKTGRRQVLEPMSAGERRIIHIELQEHPAVITESIGADPYRKVSIIPKDS
ncbi:MAG: RNA-binding cell elongation regulator Jag/EloR [Anaerolineae bacterium]|nr:RNA-binding cell elongation regulator Jag/EloR [Anaerolineae bacterium]MDK1080619.1 RNA-binding cell elongation regulator Jag/EloR [Anaerolineae bacterium]MDK1117587.1 RNA-binding cell elongation regulator Jag/EloR [Anaerolineae bacterium]